MDDEYLYYSVKQLIEKNINMQTDIEISNVQIINDGFSNDIATFYIKYTTPQRTISKEIVYKDYSKDYKGNNGITKYKKELSIFRNMSLKKYINMPKIYFADEEKTVVLMEKLNGLTLDKVYLNQPEKFHDVIKKFGKSFACIHSLDFKSLPESLYNYHSDPNTYFNDYINTLRKRVVDFGEDNLQCVLDSIVEKFKAVNFEKGCLNHGDYHFWNTLLTPDDKLYILDWEKAKIADYRYDIANTLTLCYSWFGIDFKKTMLDSYMNITKKDIPHLDCFESLLSFDSFTKCIPLIQGCDDSYCRDRSFLWVKRRYELFTQTNEVKIKKAEDYLKSKGLLCT